MKSTATAPPSSRLFHVHGRLLQRKCACGGTPGPDGECEECRKKSLQRRSVGSPTAAATLASAPPIVHEVLGSSGQPLARETRAFMEPRFGHDFARVRVHTDARAQASARAVGALAYTVGNQIVFGAGQHAPGTVQGNRLLAHELTHVVQQSDGVGSPAQTASHEHQAEAVAAQVSDPGPAAPGRMAIGVGSAPRGLMRVPDPCQAKCEEDFNRCLDHTTFPPECIAARGVCYNHCPPSAKPDNPPAPAPAPTAPSECAAPHPVGLHTTGRLAGGLGYGMITIHTWKSSTGKLEDLKDCRISENITYSKIPNPPYGLPDGTPVAESGTTARIGDHPMVGGVGKDTHRAPSEWIRKPPSAGSYTVTQTYDYKCSGCGDNWVPFAHYLITSKVYQDKASGEWKHLMTKVGSQEQAGDSEEMDETIT